jgi:alpha-tubulin suppressor-like RCC1 family protein
MKVWAWGRSDHSQTGNVGHPGVTCGDASAVPRIRCVAAPFQIPDKDKRLVDLLGISAGGAHSLALKADGTVWAWGSTDQAQIGVPGGSDDVPTPVRVWTNDTQPPVYLDNAFGVAAGDTFSLAVKQDGTVWAWGLNTFGQLGLTNEQGRAVKSFAHQIPDLNNVRDVAAGDSFALALKSDGTVWAWGLNNHGQLGAPSSDKCGPQQLDCSYKPIQVKNLTGVSQIAAGGSHALALSTS